LIQPLHQVNYHVVQHHILCYLFELNNYPYKSLEDLAAMLKINIPSLKRSFERAIIAKLSGFVFPVS